MGGEGKGRAGRFSLKQSPLERVGGHPQDCLLGEGSVRDWICKWREPGFQFCLRKSSVQGWSRDGGGLPSHGGVRWLPIPGWACTGRAGPCSPRAPGPHAAFWGARASVWGGPGLWEVVPACQNPVVQEWLWEMTSCCYAGCDASPHLRVPRLRLVLARAPLASLARVLTVLSA